MVTTKKNTNEIAKPNNNNIDNVMFNRLVEQVSQIASSLQELRAHVFNPWRPQAPLPMVQYPTPLSETSQTFIPQVTSNTTIPTDNVVSVTETSQKTFTEVPMDTVKHDASEETLEDLNIKALEILSKYHKQDKNISVIIAILQYFLVLKCKQKFHSNWVNKKDFTRAELLLALTINPTVFGSEFESSIQSAWIRHLKDNQEVYARVLNIINIVILKASDDADVKHCIGKLTHYLISPKNIIFTKKSIVKETLEKQPATKDVVKKPNIKYIVKIALDQILIQFLDTALSLQLLADKSIFYEMDEYLLKQFKISEYSHVCKYLIDATSNQLQERAKLAQEKRQKKNLTVLEDTSIKKGMESSIKNKDGNLGS